MRSKQRHRVFADAFNTGVALSALTQNRFPALSVKAKKASEKRENSPKIPLFFLFFFAA